MNSVEKELNNLLIQQQEELFYHSTMESEISFYRSIQNGDMNHINQIINSNDFWKAHFDVASHLRPKTGILSKDPIRNERYHFIVLIAMITRFAIEGGLDSETAYTLSDLFIQKADLTNTIPELLELKKSAVEKFTSKMNKLKTKEIPSKPVVLAIEYIDNNITKEISPSTIASYVDRDVSYLTKLFRKYTSMTLNEYILFKKIMTSKYLLENSNISSTDIAAFLNFSSASHFTSVFKKYESVTPSQYRKNIFRNAMSSLTS